MTCILFFYRLNGKGANNYLMRNQLLYILSYKDFTDVKLWSKHKLTRNRSLKSGVACMKI